VVVLSVVGALVTAAPAWGGALPLNRLHLASSKANHTVGDETLSAGCHFKAAPGETSRATVTMSKNASGAAVLTVKVPRAVLRGSVSVAGGGRLRIVESSAASRWVLLGRGSKFVGTGRTVAGSCTVTAPESLTLAGSGLTLVRAAK
jgi:hypothetical protein